MRRSNPIKLCILNIDGYSLYNPGYRHYFGGAEVQLYLLAKSLAKTGRFDINVVVSDHGQRYLEIYDNVKVFPHSGYRSRATTFSKYPWVYVRWWMRRLRRGISFRLQKKKQWNVDGLSVSTSRLSIYNELNAQVYLTRWNTPRAAELAFFCHQQGKPFIFCAATPGDFTEPSKANPGQKYVINQSSVHVVQTQSQQETLQRYYGYSSIKVPSLVDLEPYSLRDIQPKFVLWVGKVDEVKRPELALSLARQLPKYQFIMIANSSNNDHYNHHFEPLVNNIPNLLWIDYVPYQQIETYFAKAKLLINTSVYEGFPNTFLQAAKYGVPIISLNVDPDGIFSSKECGIDCNGNLSDMARQIELLMESPEMYSGFSRNCLNYVHDQRTKNKDIIQAYEAAINSCL